MKKKTAYKGTILVTGGARRIGSEICLSLAKQGYSIALHFHKSKSDAEKTAKLIRDNEGICSIFPCNLVNESKCKNLIAAVYKKHPDLVGLINNASIFSPSSLTNNGTNALKKNLQLHLVAPYILSQQFSKICKKGNIINILDTRITNNKTRYFDYLLSKKALGELTRMSAAALAPRIRVNAIAPGLVLPPKNKSNQYLDRLAKNIPLKKKVRVENITRSIIYLLENTDITGQILFNDGGEHLL